MPKPYSLAHKKAKGRLKTNAHIIKFAFSNGISIAVAA
jgi:hypothetical protein